MTASKIRIHELAKELGLENKAVLDLCDHLGIQGKKSHSNSLSDDEADRIRRSVIRQAVSEKEDGSTREIKKEGRTVTEKRLGNVIRRRKKSEEEEAAEAEAAARQIDLSDVPQGGLALSALSPDLGAERNSRESALARANALFKERGTEEESPAAAKSTASARQELRTEGSAAVESETHIESDSEPTAETSVASEAQDLEAEAEQEAASAEPEAVTETAQAAESAPADNVFRMDDARKRQDFRGGARVLGKIELPQQPVVEARRPESRTDARPGARTDARPGAVQAEEEARASRGKAVKKKTVVAEDVTDPDRPKKTHKKKQILRKDDLLDYDGGERDTWRKGRDKKKKKDDAGGEVTVARAIKRIVKIDQEISVGELAKILGAKSGDVVLHLMNLGVKATLNQLLDFDTATLVASEYGFTTVNIGHDEEGFVANLSEADNAEDLVLRPPVVTVMGHVDHGKTSLLDAIRKTSVTTGEAGGITQHIGAYNVRLPSGGSVTFLDTPGHEAFTAMRGRGAKVTDIVVLVVAADDGIMPQTIEAINHAQAAKVPIIVAVNKIDKESANPDRVKQQMTEHGLVPEDWGGDTIVVHVSAHTKQGIDLLLENLHVQSEILELKANPKRHAIGTVIESKLDRGRGPVISVLVQNGTLKKGDSFIAGSMYGRVRALINEDGKNIDEAGPSIPVEVIGASGTPLAGDDFFVLATDAEARQVAEHRALKQRTRELASKGGVTMGMPLTLENFSAMAGVEGQKELNIILKADVQGSLEAVADALSQLATEEVKVKILHKGVGAISENDVQLAAASNAIIIGFNIRSEPRAATAAENLGVDVRYSRIIYELVDMIKASILGLHAPVFKEKTLGRVEVRQTFRVPKLGMIAGSYVMDGMVQRGASVRLLRDNRVVFEGKMASLRRFKDDVREVQAGYECGIGIEGYSDIKDGDIIEVYKIEEVPRTSL